MNALEYFLKDVKDNIDYDKEGNLYIDFGDNSPGDLMEFTEKFSIDMYDGTYLVMRDTCEMLRQYEVVGEDIQYSEHVRRPYYRMRGKPVTREQALEIIRRTSNFLCSISEVVQQKDYMGWCNFYSWIFPDGHVGRNGVTVKFPTKHEYISEWLYNLIEFSYLDLVIAVTWWDETNPAVSRYGIDSSFRLKDEWERPEYDGEFYDAVVLGIYVHDKKVELLNPEDTIRTYKEYAHLYGQDWARYTHHFYKQSNVERADGEYMKRCVAEYGLDADAIEAKYPCLWRGLI